MRIRAGFSLIEFSMALAASAMLLVGLFQILSNTIRVTNITRAYAQDTIGVSRAVQRLRDDMSQMYLPLSARIAWYKAYTQAHPKAVRGVPYDVQPVQALIASPQPALEQEQEALTCEPNAVQAFTYSVRESVKEWSFWSTSSLRPQPILPVHIFYRVEPDPEREGLLRMRRREDISGVEGRWYTLLTRIVSCDVRMRVPDFPAPLRTAEDEQAARSAWSEWKAQPVWSVKQVWELVPDAVADTCIIPLYIECAFTLDQALAGGATAYSVAVYPVAAQQAVRDFVQARISPEQKKQQQPSMPAQPESQKEAS